MRPPLISSPCLPLHIPAGACLLLFSRSCIPLSPPFPSDLRNRPSRRTPAARLRRHLEVCKGKGTHGQRGYLVDRTAAGFTGPLAETNHATQQLPTLCTRPITAQHRVRPCFSAYRRSGFWNRWVLSLPPRLTRPFHPTRHTTGSIVARQFQQYERPRLAESDRIFV